MVRRSGQRYVDGCRTSLRCVRCPSSAVVGKYIGLGYLGFTRVMGEGSRSSLSTLPGVGREFNSIFEFEYRFSLWFLSTYYVYMFKEFIE